MHENVEPNAFDDVPLDQLKGQAFVVPEEAEPAEVSDDLSLPLSARLIAAKPPTRKQAYTELSALLNDSAGNGALFEEHGPQLKKMLTDNAPLCHDGALSVALSFALKGPQEAVTTVAAMIAQVVVDKHLSGKFQAKVDVILALVQAGAAALVQGALVKGAAHKVPKTCAASAKVLTAVLRAFGPVLDMRALLVLPASLVEHRDKAVRVNFCRVESLQMECFTLFNK